MSENWSKWLCSKGVGHFERKFNGNGTTPIYDCWLQKTRVPRLSYGVVFVILRLAILVEHRDRQTNGRTDTAVA